MSHCYSSQVSLILLFFSQQEKKCQMVSVEVRKSQHKYVIGPRGSNIAEILHETGVSVEMPSPDSTTETITLRGPQEKLGQGGFLYFCVCSLVCLCFNSLFVAHRLSFVECGSVCSFSPT